MEDPCGATPRLYARFFRVVLIDNQEGYVEKLDMTGMLARELLMLWRQHQPRPPAQLLARNGTPGAEASSPEN